MKNRIIAIVLAVGMLFSLASCKKEEPGEVIPPKDKELVVENEPVKYTEAQIADAADRIVALTVDYVKLFNNMTVDENKQASIRNVFINDVPSILYKTSVYADELFEMLECAEKAMEQSREEGNSDLDFIISLAADFNGILDAERFGSLVYNLQLLRLDKRLISEQERYDKYGYKFYFENVERYKALIAKTEDIGEKRFSDAFSVSVFMVSSAGASYDFEDGGAFGVATGDVFLILKKQGERFAAIDLSEAEWQVIGELCEEFIPKRGSADLNGKVLGSLNDDDFLIGAASVMPSLIQFYKDITADISEDNIDIIESGEHLAYERVIFGELIKHEEGLRALLATLEEKIPPAGSYSLSTVKTYDKAGYTKFTAKGVASADELVDAIKTFLKTPTDENLDKIGETSTLFMAGINPVIAYVYIYN